ncbi:Uncharacterised protein [Vibrio cholerae]|nr:Uncharacterised protein [Vibrio cholerae]
MERACVSLSTPKSKIKGSGEAYQSWKSDQQSGTNQSTRPGSPLGARAPVSACATISCTSCDGVVVCVMYLILIIDVP